MVNKTGNYYFVLDFSCNFGSRSEVVFIWGNNLKDCGIERTSSPKAWGTVSGYSDFGAHADGGQGGNLQHKYCSMQSLPT